MNREISTIVFTLLLVLTLQSPSMGQLTPLTPGTGKIDPIKVTADNQAAFPLLLASHQPVTDLISDEEETTDINPPQICPECEGSLWGSRWCDNENGTVTDLTTGLVWLKSASWGWAHPFWEDSIEGINAFDRAAQVKAGEPEELTDNSTTGDWRLPTLNELKGLTSGDEAVSASNMQAFIDVQPDWYWSATSYGPGADSAWNVGMHYGDINNSNKAYQYFVWPVRNGND